MSPKPIAKVTTKHLQTLLSHIGAATSGTKSVLHTRFTRALAQPVRLDQRVPSSENLRIVSIDMGLKNLAFCAMEVDFAASRLDPKMRVTHWEKRDLTSPTLPPNTLQDIRKKASSGKDAVSAAASDSSGDLSEEIHEDAFSLPIMSRTAYTLIKHTILTTNPHIILIEKQRWRSGGGAAVQQWTLRVNTLEGMLWAVLETIRGERAHAKKDGGKEEVGYEVGYEVLAVDPKRVGQFWLSGDEKSEDEAVAVGGKKLKRGVVEKKAKIRLLRGWLVDEKDFSTGEASLGASKISFEFDESADSVRRALCGLDEKQKVKQGKVGKAASKNGTGEAKAEVSAMEMKKLDDVTDCFLQAAAWVRWEMNRFQLQGVQKQRKAGKGSEVGEADDEVLLSMINKMNQND